MDNAQGAVVPALVPDLLAFLNASSDTAERLAELLEREYDALVSWSPDSILATAGAKQRLLDELETHYTQWQARLAEHDMQPGTDSVNLLIRAFGPQEPQLVNAWTAFCTALQRLREANGVNCELAQSATRQTHQLLALLQGEPSAPLYGPGGRPATGTPTRLRDEI